MERVIMYVTCDSVYMGAIMAHIAQNACQINMVGTIQPNHNGAPMGQMGLHKNEPVPAIWTNKGSIIKQLLFSLIG